MSSTADLLVRDVGNSPAYLILDDLLRKGKLTPAQVGQLKEKYQKLHGIVTQSLKDESTLLSKAKELKSHLETLSQKLTRQDNDNREIQVEVAQMKKEEEITTRQSQAMEEHVRDVVNTQLEDLQANRKLKKARLEDKYKKQFNAMELEIVPLREQIEELTEAMKKCQTDIDKEQKQVQDYQDQLEINAKHLANHEKGKLKKRETNHLVSQEPEKLRKSIAIVDNVKESVRRDLNKLMEEIKSVEQDLEECREEKMFTDNEAKLHLKNKQNVIITTANKLSDMERIKSEQERDRHKHQEALEEQREIELDKQILKQQLRNQLEQASRYQKEYDLTKKGYSKLRNKKDTIMYSMPSLDHQISILDNDKQELQRVLEKKRKMHVEIKNDEELYISQYLAEEKLDEDTTELLDAVNANRKDFETRITKLRKQERELKQEISKLTSRRELTATDASKSTQQYREQKEILKIKNLILIDLDKLAHESVVKLSLLNNKYEKMKNQRNKLATLTQSQTQAVAEMKEKIKILQNEVEILRNESIARDRALAEEMRIHQNAKNTRDAERVERDKKKSELRAKKEEQAQQKMEIEKYNSIVNAAERQMMRLRTDYAQAVDNRNLTGIQLIDRNDECSILYEKKNVQASILKKGHSSLEARKGSIKSVHADIRELRRAVEVARKKIPSLAVYAATVRTLEKVEISLNQEKQLTQQLCERLETPTYNSSKQQAEGKASRARMLGGMDPEPEQLAAKTEILEERLNEKKEQLLEKELVLDEVSSLTDKLRMQAAESRGATLELAQQVNQVQSKIRQVIRKMMATVSELSMYQATAMKLEQQERSKQDELEAARQNVVNGYAPTEKIQQEWYRLERDRIRRQEAMLKRADAGKQMFDAMETGTLTRTTAAPRPDAYVTEKFGLPKPYGALAPFKPSVQGATRRHIRKPVPQAVIL